MNLEECDSNGRAKSALILGHTTTGMGERVLAQKTEILVKQAGFESLPIVDLIELMGENYERYARLNYDLADGGHSLIEGIESLSLPKADIALILSWSFSLAALFATDLRRTYKIVAKLYAHHPDERILPKLYEPADLLITESLLGNERGATYGIDPAKMLYLPHCYLDLPVQKKGKRKKRVIGTVARLEYGKNCEFAIEAVRRLAQKGHDVLLYLKGDFPEESLFPEYKPLMTEMLEAYRDEEWLVWDPTPSPFPEILETIAQFDLLLHPSGAEGGSHVVVEALGLGVPCVVLNCSTNPFLFKGLATFVKTTGEIRPAQLPFYVPDLNDLVDKLARDLPRPDQASVCERFHPDVARERIPLLFDPDPEKIVAYYKEDLKRYGL
ncbi:MAG: glycosyltransferase family 4 protein [Chlamydiales bacterium]|nr:glycosyltransferase family 4 protein [Chlamydiales bacterium]